MGDWLMEQHIRRPDCCTLTDNRSLAIFGGWRILEAWNILVEMWPIMGRSAGLVENLGSSGPYFYYIWQTDHVGRVEAMRAMLTVLGTDIRAMCGQSKDVELAVMEPVWHEGRTNWTSAETMDLLNESLGRTGFEVEEIVVPNAASPTVEYEDKGE